MRTDSDPLAELAEAIGQALLRFAEQVRSPAQPTAPAPPAGAAARHALGGSQARVLAALTAAGESGMTAKEAADATDLKPTNTHSILNALVQKDLARVVGERPKVWQAQPAVE